jgi:signal transduction histidine kinase
MRRRLILSTALISLAAVVVLGVPLGVVEAARLRQDVETRLEREADAVAGVVDDRLERHRPIPPSLLRQFVRPAHRIVVVPVDGPAIVTRPPIGGEVLRARAGSGGVGRVIAEAPVGELDDRVHRAWLLIATLSAGSVLIAVALAALQARRLARPLEAIARRSEQLGDGDFSVRVGRVGVPEIDAIAQGLDVSAGRIAELVAREREFSANVSHQLRTPLTALRLRIEEAGALDDPATRAREIDAALSETDRLEATIAELLAHARQAGTEDAAIIDLAAIVADHATTWRRVFQRAGRDLRAVASAGIQAHASRGTVGQVLDVLLDNALRHGKGTTTISLAAEPPHAVLTVVDEGVGVDEADRDRIFERGASRGMGAGIGLHLARALAQADSANLRALAGAPTRFELRLRIATGSARG